VAMFAAVAAGERPAVLALASAPTGGSITFPCGACLQVALELGGPDMLVVAVTPEGKSEQTRLDALLPRGPRKG
jgi:cytidine deaminase